MAALNEVLSDTGLLTIPCGPLHLGQARAWAQPQVPWTAWNFQQANQERIPLRAAMVLWAVLLRTLMVTPPAPTITKNVLCIETSLV